MASFDPDGLHHGVFYPSRAEAEATGLIGPHHVLHSQYSRSVDHPSHLKDVLDGAPLGATSSVDVRQYLDYAYDMAYGIVDYETSDNPFVRVGYHDNEALYGNQSPFEQSLSKYLETEVGELLRMSFDEWIDYPRHYQEVILEVCKRYREAKRAREGPIPDLPDLNKLK